MLKECVVCGKEVSTKAKKCPQCGQKKPTKDNTLLSRVKKEPVLSECVGCGEQVSTWAKKCPQCGEIKPTKERVPCIECGEGIPRYKSTCPNCGNPEIHFLYEHSFSNWHWKTWSPKIFLLIVLFYLLMGLLMLFGWLISLK